MRDGMDVPSTCSSSSTMINKLHVFALQFTSKLFYGVDFLIIWAFGENNLLYSLPISTTLIGIPETRTTNIFNHYVII
jgi:hypothetical protein